MVATVSIQLPCHVFTRCAVVPVEIRLQFVCFHFSYSKYSSTTSLQSQVNTRERKMEMTMRSNTSYRPSWWPINEGVNWNDNLGSEWVIFLRASTQLRAEFGLWAFIYKLNCVFFYSWKLRKQTFSVPAFICHNKSSAMGRYVRMKGWRHVLMFRCVLESLDGQRDNEWIVSEPFGPGLTEEGWQSKGLNSCRIGTLERTLWLCRMFWKANMFFCFLVFFTTRQLHPVQHPVFQHSIWSRNISQSCEPVYKKDLQRCL